MPSFQPIYDRAAQRKGGPAALDALIKDAKPKSKAALAKIPDHRWLAQITKGVFSAGFNWKVIDKKWPGFEEAFEGFDPARWSMMSDEDIDRLLQDTRIVRHGAKIASVRGNALFLRRLADTHGTAAKAIAGWPATDYIGLLALFKKEGARLGGSTAQYVLRFSGVDSFILSRDVSAALVTAGVVEKVSASQKTMTAVQQAFNGWMEETGRPLTQLSRILALSTDS